MKRMIPYLMIMVLLGATGAWGQEVVSGGPEEEQGVMLAQAEDAGASGAADEWSSGDAWEETEELPPVHYMLDPVIKAWLGYRIVSVDGSNRALEYGWPHSSPTGGILLHYSPLPHRVDFELDMSNHNDYNAEVSYAYRDIFKLNYRGWALYHNLDHWNLQEPTYFVENNPGAFYHATARDNRVFLRLKWPDRAFHLFAEYRQFDKDGTVQQRVYKFEGGSNKTSRSRDIEWTTRKYTAGINGHLGPVEVEYSHRTKTFDSGRNSRLVNQFDLAGGAFWSHHAVPDLETNSDTVKIHTDLQGRIVGSATLVKGDKDNKQSGSDVDFWRAYTDLVLIPLENVTVALKYRYDLLEVDNPEYVDEFDAVTGGLIRTEPTNASMHRRTNRAEATVRYSPMNSLSFKAGYTFTKTERFDAVRWNDPDVIPFQGIPSDQNEHKVLLGFSARPWRELKFKGSVNYAYVQDPAYPAKPQNSFKGRFNATWTPTYSVTADAYYRFARENNNSANMDLGRDNLGVLGTWAPTQSLAFYANYDFNRLTNERDLQFIAGGFGNTAPFPVDVVEYKDSSHLYAIGATYRFSFPLKLDAGFHQSWSKGLFRTNVTGDDLEPTTETTAGIGELTDLRIRETGGSCKAAYDFPRGWSASVEYTVNNYEDMKDKPQNGSQDGTAHSGMVMISKTW